MNRGPSSSDSVIQPDWKSGSAPVIERAPLPMLEVEGPAHTVCFVNQAFCDLVKQTRDELIGKTFATIVFNGANCVPLLDRVYQTGKSETHAELDGSELEEAYWLYAMWPALNADEQPVRVVIQLTRSSIFRKNAVAMNEALLIAGLRQHELREEAEAMNLRLQSEIAERTLVESALTDAKTQLRAEAEELENKVTQRTVQLRTSIDELEAFSYSLAHDLRAPVRAIRGFTQMVLEMPASEVSPSAAEHLNRVVKAAVRMDSLIQDVLSLSEVILKPIKMGPVDVAALIEALIQERPEFSQGRAEIKMEGPLLQMWGHEASLSQCISNLLSNAVKFVAPGAKPRVRLWTEELPSLIKEKKSALELVATSRPTVRLWIEDQGIGIAEDQHERIFQIFQRLHSTSQYEGTGIGLAIVRKAIDRMGGTVGFISKVGEGSRFWLELPKG